VGPQASPKVWGGGGLGDEREGKLVFADIRVKDGSNLGFRNQIKKSFNYLIINGGLEAPICNSGFCLFNNIDWWIVLQSDATTGPLIEIDNTAFVCHSGIQCTDMASTGAVNIYLQTFPTQPGNTYVLFWEAANPDCSSSTISVSVTASLLDSNGVVLATVSFPFTGGDSVTNPSNMGWILYTLTLVASTIETTLLFTGTTQFSSCGPVLDDVSVINTSV